MNNKLKNAIFMEIFKYYGGKYVELPVVLYIAGTIENELLAIRNISACII